MSYLTAEGIVAPTLDEIRADVAQDMRDNIDSRIDMSSQTAHGQASAIIADRIRSAAETLEDVWSAHDVDSASGAALDNLLKTAGLVRLAATKSRARLSLTLDGGVTVPAGSVIAVSGNESTRFETIAPATNPGGSPAVIEVDADAEAYGPVVANSGTLTIISTPVTGWTAVTNALDASRGRLRESDSAARLRLQTIRFMSNGGIASSLRSHLLDVAGVQQVTIVANETNDTLPQPINSIQCVIYDGTTPAASDTEIAQAIWDRKPAGVATYGGIATVVSDSAGISRTINWSRSPVIDVYVSMKIVINPELFPADGLSQVTQAIVDYGDARYGPGSDVVIRQLECQALEVNGVEDVTITQLDTAPITATSPSQNLEFDTEVPDLDTSRISVSIAAEV